MPNLSVSQSAMPQYAKILTPNSLEVHFYDNGESFALPSTHPQFQPAVEAVHRNAPADEVRKLMDIVGTLAQAVSAFSAVVSVDRNGVYYKGKQLHMTITDRMLQFQAQGLDIDYLVKFLENLFQNPIRGSVLSLYDFLEHGHVPITPDGCFLAYKKVRSNYKDIHSNKFDNSVGANPKVESWEVDEDRNRECSFGLHVCSKSYLPSFGSSGNTDRVVVVKVNPAHVVAVPRDYNFAKMRVTEYLVVGELTSQDHAGVFDKHAAIRPGQNLGKAIDWDENLHPDACGNECPGIDDPDCCDYDPPQDEAEDDW